MNIDIKNGDCLELLKTIPDKSIDLILTDPPYLMNYKTNHRKDKNHKFCKEIANDGNKSKQLIEEVIKLTYSKLKDNSHFYCFCNDVAVDFFITEIKKYFNIKNILIWVKNNWTAGDLNGSYGRKHEFIIFASKGRKELNGKRDHSILEFDRVSGKNLVHQNQKPIDLLEFLIKKSSNENDVVLDPFMGSASTGIACINLKRDFIGFELDEAYFNIAKQRIDKHLATFEYKKSIESLNEW